MEMMVNVRCVGRKEKILEAFCPNVGGRILQNPSKGIVPAFPKVSFLNGIHTDIIG